MGSEMCIRDRCSSTHSPSSRARFLRNTVLNDDLVGSNRRRQFTRVIDAAVVPFCHEDRWTGGIHFRYVHTLVKTPCLRIGVVQGLFKLQCPRCFGRSPGSGHWFKPNAGHIIQKRFAGASFILRPRGERNDDNHRSQRYPSSSLYHGVKVPYSDRPCNKKAPAMCRGFSNSFRDALEADGIPHVAEFQILLGLLAEVGIFGQCLAQVILDAR